MNHQKMENKNSNKNLNNEEEGDREAATGLVSRQYGSRRGPTKILSWARTPEELELVIETKSGIVMNYKTTRRKLNFDLENKLLKNVKLKSKNEVLLIQTSDEKLNISLGEYNKNPDENMIQGYQLQSDSHPIQEPVSESSVQKPRNLAELLHSHSLREEQDVEVVIDNGVPAEQEYCSTSYENCAVHGEDHLES